MPAASADSSPQLAVIGGSGLYCLQESADGGPRAVQTPYAEAPVTAMLEHTRAGSIWFIPRHGLDHSIAPHLINYRANIWALHHLGVKHIIAVNAVGGIDQSMTPGTLVLPNQVIDYTFNRDHTFFAGEHALDRHVDFTWPYDAALGDALMQAAAAQALVLQRGGVYGCTQGPRLETAAEIRKLQRDGCAVVGMTGMPEAALARELGLRYACLALVVNKAAGLGNGEITHEQIVRTLASGMARVRQVLLAALPGLTAAG